MSEPVELTILMPCLNEAETLARCIETARLGIQRAGVPGEIIVADNGSTDGSPAIARKLGARVVPVKDKGYGGALRGGIRAALGKWILMGDADDSYDFSEADRFVKKFQEGFELVMGCRLPIGGGTILPGAKTSFNSARFSRPPFRWHSIRQRLEMGLSFTRMRNLWRVLLAVAVLMAALAIGASRNKSAADAARYEKATLAGGCFWSLQETLRQIPGVIKTTVGYTGGTLPNPTYEQVAAGNTGHAEAVEVVFDPARLSYEELLADFLAARIPARQSTSAHRPAIFYHDEGQRQAAERVTDTINQSGKWNSPLIVEITPATKFYPAEEYHQDYFLKMSAARNCSLE